MAWRGKTNIRDTKGDKRDGLLPWCAERAPPEPELVNRRGRMVDYAGAAGNRNILPVDRGR